MSSMQEAVEKLKQTMQEQTPETESSEPVEQVAKTEPEQVQDEPEQAQETEDVTSETTEEVEADAGAERIELEAEQLAEILGLKPEIMDVNEEGRPVFKAKIDGETVDASLDQLLDAYQRDAYLTNRSKELSEMRKQRETELATLQAHNQQFAQQTAALLEGLKEQYLAPFDQINWAELKEEDPAVYAAQMQDKRATEERLAAIASQALNQINQAQETQSQELQKQYAEYLNNQVEMVKQKIPNFDKVQGEITAYMQNIGFEDSEINQVADHRIIDAMYKAMLFDKGKKSAKEKLAKPLPKVLKPGKSPTKQDLSLEQEQKLQARLKETGSMHDAVALLRSKRR